VDHQHERDTGQHLLVQIPGTTQSSAKRHGAFHHHNRWTPGHDGIPGNRKSGREAKKGHTWGLQAQPPLLLKGVQGLVLVSRSVECQTTPQKLGIKTAANSPDRLGCRGSGDSPLYASCATLGKVAPGPAKGQAHY